VAVEEIYEMEFQQAYMEKMRLKVVLKKLLFITNIY